MVMHASVAVSSVLMNSETERHRARRGGGGRAFRSRVEPFVDFIREQRQRRCTWKEIADQLRAQKGCAITFQGLHQFYRRYLKRQARPRWEDEPSSRLEPLTNVPAIVRKSAPAAVPESRPFRRPNPDTIKLNDPTEL